MFKALKAAAQATTKTNAQLLQEWVAIDRNTGLSQESAFEDEVSGMNSNERMFIGSMALSLSGVFGMVAPALSNAAVGLATVGGAASMPGTAALASLAPALMGLGTVAIGGVALPLISVAAFGAMVVGTVAMVYARMRGTENDDIVKESVRSKTDQLRLRGQLNSEGKNGTIGFKNWGIGAKNLILQSIDNFVNAKENKRSSFNTIDDSNKTSGIQSNVSTGDLFDDIMDQYEHEMNASGMACAVRQPDKEKGEYCGKVIAENLQFVVVGIGRSSVLLDRSDLPHNLNVQKGAALDVKFKSGVAAVRNHGVDQSRGSSVER